MCPVGCYTLLPTLRHHTVSQLREMVLELDHLALKPDCVTLNNILKYQLHGCLTYKMTTVPTSRVAINIKQVNACLLFEKYLEYSKCPVAPLVAQW